MVRRCETVTVCATGQVQAQREGERKPPRLTLVDELRERLFEIADERLELLCQVLVLGLLVRVLVPKGDAVFGHVLETETTIGRDGVDELVEKPRQSSSGTPRRSSR